MSHLPGKFVWFECVTRDAKRAQAFYGEVLGWKVEAFPMGDFTYEMIKAGATAIGGYAPPADAKTPPHWISYLSVDDVDAAVKRVTAAGGKLLDGPSDIPTVGRMAKVADPQGAIFQLFRASDGDPADGPSANGQFYWNELWAADGKKAVAFYEKVAGFTHKDMDMGPEGTYHVLEKGDKSRAGIMTSTRKDVAPMWLPYVAVDDCDAAVARAKKQGGAVHVEPTDIPNIGRFAILSDPTGATIAVIKPASP